MGAETCLFLNIFIHFSIVISPGLTIYLFYQSRKKQREEVDVVGVATSSEIGGAAGGAEGKTREQMIHDRIGYKPHPKPNTLPSLFGNLSFWVLIVSRTQDKTASSLFYWYTVVQWHINKHVIYVFLREGFLPQMYFLYTMYMFLCCWDIKAWLIWIEQVTLRRAEICFKVTLSIRVCANLCMCVVF